MVTTPTDSNLNGYILPLLNQLANERSAALISEALNQLGKPYEKDAQGTGFNNLSLPIAVYRGVFDIKGIETYDQLSRVGKQTSLEKSRTWRSFVLERRSAISQSSNLPWTG